jgi:NADH dehydrogenase
MVMSNEEILRPRGQPDAKGAKDSGDDDRHHVVIVGAGFGGLHCALALRRHPVRITLLDKRNFHLFQPLLFQVATGVLSPAEIAAPTRVVFRRNENVTCLVGEVTDIDPVARAIVATGQRIHYDTLVVATGSETAYFGHEDWMGNATGLKTVEEALVIRNKIYSAFELAERELDPARRRQLLTFVTVGGGATGVELTGALCEIARHTLKRDFRRIRSEEARILLVNGGDRVLGGFPERLSAKAQKSLERLGAEVMSHCTATDIDVNGISFADADGNPYRIAAKTVFWAAGVKASSLGAILARSESVELDRSGRVLVNEDLSIPGHPEMFVIGDLALYEHQGDRPLPGVATVAIAEGRYVARLVRDRLRGRKTKPFRYVDEGLLATIGRGRAVANIFGLSVSGYPAWLIWLFVHLMALVSFDNRLMVFVRWLRSYLTWDRGARIVTYEPPLPDRSRFPS